MKIRLNAWMHNLNVESNDYLVLDRQKYYDAKLVCSHLFKISTTAFFRGLPITCHVVFLVLVSIQTKVFTKFVNSA